MSGRAWPKPEGVPQGVIWPNAKGFGDCLCRSYLAAVREGNN